VSENLPQHTTKNICLERDLKKKEKSSTMYGDSIEINFQEASASSGDHNNDGYFHDCDGISSPMRSFHEEINLACDRENSLTFEVNYRGADLSGPMETLTFVAPLTTEVPASRCAEMLGASALSSNYNSIHERLDVTVDNYSINKMVPSQCFAPGVLSGLLGVSSGVKVPFVVAPAQPPLLPAVTLNTMFTCDRILEDIVHKISSVFDYFGDKLTAQHFPNEFSWHCRYISENCHVDFVVRIYRYAKRHELNGSFAVEFQRLEGDRLPYMNSYNACRDLLTSCDCDIYDYFSAQNMGGSVGFSTVFDCSSGVPSESRLSAEAAAHDKSIIKDSIVKQLSVQATYSNLLECVQLISSLYTVDSNETLAAMKPTVTDVDTELFLALCDVARKYSSNSRDWIYQHSIIAVADMLSLFVQCGDACSSRLVTVIKNRESVVSLLQTMSGMHDDNCFVTSKSEAISKMISMMC
jgi:hypothetical protein